MSSLIYIFEVYSDIFHKGTQCNIDDLKSKYFIKNEQRNVLHVLRISSIIWEPLKNKNLFVIILNCEKLP